jgi:hypothetical protein
MITQVDQFDIHVATSLSLLQNPLGGGVGKSGRPRRADDHGNLWLRVQNDLLYKIGFLR